MQLDSAICTFLAILGSSQINEQTVLHPFLFPPTLALSQSDVTFTLQSRLMVCEEECPVARSWLMIRKYKIQYRTILGDLCICTCLRYTLLPIRFLFLKATLASEVILQRLLRSQVELISKSKDVPFWKQSAGWGNLIIPFYDWLNKERWWCFQEFLNEEAVTWSVS